MIERICKLCGEKFTTKAGRQFYCKKEIIKKCPVCGDDFVTYCQPENAITCSKPECKKKAGYIGSISKKKVCKLCGREFQPTSSTQECCNLDVERTCKVCGKTFTIKCTEQAYKIQTCSTECMQKIASIHRKENYSMSHEVECILCGKMFHPVNNTQRVCSDRHFRKCVNCGKEFEIFYTPSKGLQNLRKTCSDKCYREWMSKNNTEKAPEALEKRKETLTKLYGPDYSAKLVSKSRDAMMEKYGIAYALQDPEFKSKAIKTNQERWGADWAIGSDKIREKSENTLKEHYNVTNPMQIPGIIEKSSKSYEEKTGYRFPMQNPEVKEKSREHFQETFGVNHYSSTEEFKESFKNTSLERYGTENPMQNEDVKEKAKQTCLERYDSECYLSSEEGRSKLQTYMHQNYGVDFYSQTAEYKSRVLKYCTNVEEWTEFTKDCRNYILTHYSEKPTYKKLSKQLGVKPSTVCDFICRHEETDLVKRSMSYMEEEVSSFLQTLGVAYKLHDRNSISPLEIDINLTDFNFGIECDPTATHNCSVPYRDIEGNIMDYGYHKKKTDLCEDKGIFLFHIFGYDWENKRPIVESMLRNILNCNQEVIYARKCQVKKVSWGESYLFLEKNHRQGYANSKIRLGLYYNEELVSLMTFGKMRSSIGTGSEYLDDCWELVRFCSKLNTSVVGGASRLFKHFLSEYDPERVRSFSDRAHTKGNLYLKLGFQEVRRSAPGYVWVDTASEIAYHRVNAQKKNLKKFLNDDTIDLTRTEREIMIEHGYVQVPDSGTITWEWKCS